MMTQWWSAAGGRSLLASAERWGFGGKVNLDKMKEMHEQTPAIIRKCVSWNRVEWRRSEGEGGRGRGSSYVSTT